MGLVKVFLFFTLFLASYGFAQRCHEKSDCSFLEKCCKQRFFFSGVCSYSCIGKSCDVNSDCGGGSIDCCNNICRASCLGYSCTFHSDCGGDNGYCCNGICRASCSGYSCTLHADCGGDNEYCCNYSCQQGVCGLATWLVVVIVLSVLGFVATIVGVVLRAVCAHRRRTPGLVVTHALSTVPATTTAMVADSNVNHVQGPPPPYYPPTQKPQA